MEVVVMQDHPSIIDKTKIYLTESKMTIEALASKIGYSRSVLSKVLSGKYGNSEEIEKKLEEYLESKNDATAPAPLKSNDTEPIPTATPKTFHRREFYASRDAQNVIGVCRACQENVELGIVYGESGYGKTYSLKRYAALPKVVYIECDVTMGCRDLVEEIQEALGIPFTTGTTRNKTKSIRNFFNANKGYLLIVDEADKLISRHASKRMEVLRGIFDQSSVGMIIAGEPALKVMIGAYLNRFAKRIIYKAELKGLSKKEVHEILDPFEIEPPAMELLIRRACGSDGCYRLLDKTLKNILCIHTSGPVTLDVINRASAMMML